MEKPTDSPDKAGKPERSPQPRRPGGKTKRGPNKWLLRIFRGYDASGRRIYYSETFHGGSREADDRLTELKNRQKAGMPLKFDSKTFADFFGEWLEERDDGERRECTIEHYRNVGELYLLPAFGKFAHRRNRRGDCQALPGHAQAGILAGHNLNGSRPADEYLQVGGQARTRSDKPNG